jgi:hypothetical protein
MTLGSSYAIMILDDKSASTGVAASISDTRPDAAMFLPTQHVSSHVTVKVPDFWMKDPLF